MEKNSGARGTLYHLPGVGETSATSTLRYTRENGLGSMVAQTDTSGNTVSRWEYDAYGMARYGATDPQCGNGYSTTSPFIGRRATLHVLPDVLQ